MGQQQPEAETAPVTRKQMRTTVKEKEFVENYVANGGNATKAYQAIRTHIKPSSATVEASKLLSKPNIRQEVTEALKRYKITPTWVIRKRKHLALHSDSDLVTLQAIDRLSHMAGYDQVFDEPGHTQIVVSGEKIAIIGSSVQAFLAERKQRALEEGAD